jgi:hypothetical protein
MVYYPLNAAPSTNVPDWESVLRSHLNEPNRTGLLAAVLLLLEDHYFLDTLPMDALMNIRATNLYVWKLISAYLSRRYIRLLGKYFDYPRYFRDQMRVTGAVISGYVINTSTSEDVNQTYTDRKR